MNNKYLLSVIIPIFNVEKYLEKCFKSLDQFDNFVEIILVNDGSTDSSKLVCKNWIEKNKLNWKLIDKNNGGVSSARNVGLKYSTGKYILFVDPDDEVSNNLYETIYPFFSRNIDLLTWGFKKIHFKNDKKLTEIDCFNCENYNIDSNEEILKKVLPRLIGFSMKDLQNYEISGKLNFEEKEWGSVWHFLYKRDIIMKNNIIFNENIELNEDSMFNCQYLIHCSSIKSIHKCLYLYNIKDNGAFSKKRRLVELTNNKIELLHERNIINNKLNNSIFDLYIGSNILSVLQLLLETRTEKKSFKIIKKYLTEESIIESIKLYKLKWKNFKFSIVILLLKMNMAYMVYLLIKVIKKEISV